MKSRTSSTRNISRPRSPRASFPRTKRRTSRPEADGSSRIPGATYRLQFNADFTLDQAGEILDYLDTLGVTDVYASPLFQARPNSTHGYDTCSHSRIGEGLGGEKGFKRFAAALREFRMGLLLDVVPNHMGACPANAWWWDVLEHGPASRFAHYFDIDWERGGGKVVLPVLGKELDEARARGELIFTIDENEFLLGYYENHFPLVPRSPAVKELLDFQHYKLVHWKRGPQKINYRRFFDVNELVALRMEDKRVFDETHQRAFELVRDGIVTGLRVDHPDGLRDPQQYFTRLHRCGRPRLYIVAEKILSGDETLPGDWPINGTTGYDFLNDVNGLFVSAANEAAITKLYRDFTGSNEDFAEVAYRAKKRVLHKSFAGDVDAWADRLAAITGTAPERLRQALIELVACFPVYRTYVRENTKRPSGRDENALARAFAAAHRHGAGVSPELDILEDILSLRRNDEGLRELVLRFQQLTGPAAAKGIEDTAFYRFNRLISLNEVGSDPARFGISLEMFHGRNEERARHWPHSLLATSTHDTKRGEDTRARINVLSEMPDEWRAAVFRWRESNAHLKTDLNGTPVPDATDEYLFYQTLLGTWTAEGATDAYRTHIAQYMLKAIREAKRNTSWTEPNEKYENAIASFVERVLATHNGEFLCDFASLQRTIAFFGIFNSLSQTLLKLTSPGVPDIYQGTELWDFTLVDPDNRRPVDYARRRELLDHLRTADRPRLHAETNHGGVKLFLIHRVLEFRNAHRELFDHGAYTALQVSGRAADHLCTFARSANKDCVIVVAPRLVYTLMQGREVAPLGEAAWGDTQITLSRTAKRALGKRRMFDDTMARHRWQNVLTGEIIPAAPRLNAHEILRTFPVALLASI